MSDKCLLSSGNYFPPPHFHPHISIAMFSVTHLFPGVAAVRCGAQSLDD